VPIQQIAGLTAKAITMKLTIVLIATLASCLLMAGKASAQSCFDLTNTHHAAGGKLVSSGHPVGWPCAVFKNPARVITYVRRTLIYNGWRPAMNVYRPSSRQIRFVGIVDGVQYWAIVAKTGDRRITVDVESVYTGEGRVPAQRSG